MALSFLALPLLAADPVPVVDRGLPQANLNDVSGEGRSNIRWTWNDNGLLGDEFAVGAPGVDGKEPGHLGDDYQDVRLYFGDPGTDLTPVVTARLAQGSDATGSAQARVSDVTAGGAGYRFGAWGLGRRSPEARTTTSTRPTPGSTTPRTRR